jgi:hypothetical protein
MSSQIGNAHEVRLWEATRSAQLASLGRKVAYPEVDHFVGHIDEMRVTRPVKRWNLPILWISFRKEDQRLFMPLNCCGLVCVLSQNAVVLWKADELAAHLVVSLIIYNDFEKLLCYLYGNRR